MLKLIIYVIRFAIGLAASLIIIRVIMEIANSFGDTIRKFIITEIEKYRSIKRDN